MLFVPMPSIVCRLSVVFVPVTSVICSELRIVGIFLSLCSGASVVEIIGGLRPLAESPLS